MTSSTYKHFSQTCQTSFIKNSPNAPIFLVVAAASVPVTEAMDLPQEVARAIVAANNQAIASCLGALSDTPVLPFISTDDDDRRQPVKRRRVAKNSGFWEDVVPKMTERQFKDDFRVSRKTFALILGYVSEAMTTKDTNWKTAIPVEKKLAIALAVRGSELGQLGHYFFLQTLASVSEYRVIARMFGVGKATVYRCLHLFTHACQERLVNDYIKWPSHAEFKTIASKYERYWNYPMAVGALDGSHIKIQVPKSEKTAYIDYQNNYSMTLMAICDADYCFYFCHCGMSGRNHDSRIYKSTKAHATLVQTDSLPISDRYINGIHIPYHVLADSAFVNIPRLMTPYQHRDAASSQETIFNMRHSR